MMYSFTDTNAVSDGAIMPSEALSINGEFIEQKVAGYRTLYTMGREALSPEITTYETGVRDGSKLQNKRYPARIITVGYQLIAESPEAFMEAYNVFASILDVKEAQLIFNDEPDKYYTGTPSEIGEIEPGKCAVKGEFKITCADPFKYSVIEYEAVPEDGNDSILIDYNGTYKSFPTLEADFYSEDEASEDGETDHELTGDGDCGFVAFFNENEKIIQLGDPEELDGANYPKSQSLINFSFKKTSSWGTAAKKKWGVNGGVVTNSSAVEQAGDVAMLPASYKSRTQEQTSGTLLTVTSRAGTPAIDYVLKYKTTNRTGTSVKVSVAVTTTLDKDSDSFGSDCGLKGHLYIDGEWHEFTIKPTGTSWKGKSGHTKNVHITVNALTDTTTSISGFKFKVTRTDNNGSAGSLSSTKCNTVPIGQYIADVPDSYYLAPCMTVQGSGWSGPSISRSIPADKSGEAGAKNFTLTYSQKLSLRKAEDPVKQTGPPPYVVTNEVYNPLKEMGSFQCILSDESGKIVAGVNIFKAKSGKTAKLRFYVNGKTKATYNINITYNNKYFKPGRSTTIKKSGGTVYFNVCGIIKKTFRDDELTDVMAKKVTFTMCHFKDYTPLAYNGIYWIKFVKNNCDTYKDVPNKFSTDDTVSADCRTGEIYLNGIQEQSLGALGNDWEEFYLEPGLNQIGFSYSDWVEDAYAPSFKVMYREVFL